MAARGTLLADAVVAELIDLARVWNTPQVIDASRNWLPVYKPEDVKTLKVSVFTMTLESKKIDRRVSNWETYGTIIDFQIAGQFDTNGQIIQAPLDAADLLAEQVHDFYQDAHQLTVAGLSGVKWTVMNATRADIYDLQRLYVDSVWETAIALMISGRPA